MRYLHEFKSKLTVYNTIIYLASKYGVTAGEFNSSDSITSSIYLANAGHRSILSEFPGNCSSLVLSDIQNSFYLADDEEIMVTKYTENILNLSIDICSAINYGALFVSGTSPYMKQYLMSRYGFTMVMDNLVNPHSGRINYFLAKIFSCEEDPEDDDLEDGDTEEEDTEEIT